MDKVEHIKNILNSFQRLTGRSLIKRISADKDYLEVENGNFVLVSHNCLKDPVFNYGNQFALRLWEMKWDEFIKTPSKKTAEPDLRESRSKMLKTVSKKGYFNQYEGIRVSSSGKRFKIRNAVIWNVKDDKENFIGQAAYFNSIEYLE